MRKKYRIKNVIVKTYHKFEAIYKNHYIKITREDDVFSFYIQVSVIDGSFVYNGYYNSTSGSISEAIEESLKGSCLI